MSNQINGNYQPKKKKGGGAGALVVILLMLALPRIMEALESGGFRQLFRRIQFWLFRNGIDPELLPVLIAAAVIIVVAFFLVISVISKMKAKEPGSDRVRTNSSAGGTTAAKNRPDPRTRSFVPPEPSCIVCDHTGEDHFLRDKAQRIAQLDEWLKNGLIDREEYRVLKDRYERDL